MAEWVGRKALQRQSCAVSCGWMETGKCVTSKKD